MLMAGCCTCERQSRLRSASTAVLAALALGACLSVPAGSERRIELYRAQGEGWRLRIFNDAMVLERRQGSLRSDEWGPLPAAHPLDSAVRFEGSLRETYVVAGMVEETIDTYTLDIRGEPCRDRRGRPHLTSVRIDLGPENILTGCGDRLPPSWRDSRRPPGPS